MKSPISGALSVAATKVVGLVASFAATLVMVRVVSAAYGEAIYGSVSLVSTLVSLVPIADLGMGLVLIGVAVSATERRSFSQLKLTYTTIWWLVCAVGLLGTLTSGVLSAFKLWETLLGAPSLLIGDPDLYMPAYVALGSFWLASGLWLRLLMGLQRPLALVLIQSIGPVFAAALTVIAVWVGAPPLVTAFASLLGAIASNTVAGMVASQTVRKLGTKLRILWPWRISRRTWARVLRSGLTGAWFGIGAALIFAVDRLILSNWSNASELAAYSFSVPIFSGVQGALGAVGAFLWPRYSQMRLQGGLNRRVISMHWLTSTTIGVLVAGGMLLAYPLYFQIAGVNGAPFMLLVGFGALAVLQASSLPLTSAFTSERLLRIQGIGLACAVVLKVVIASATVPAAGASGLVLATIIGILGAQFPLLIALLVRSAPASR